MFEISASHDNHEFRKLWEVEHFLPNEIHQIIPRKLERFKKAIIAAIDKATCDNCSEPLCIERTSIVTSPQSGALFRVEANSMNNQYYALYTLITKSGKLLTAAYELPDDKTLRDMVEDGLKVIIEFKNEIENFEKVDFDELRRKKINEYSAKDLHVIDRALRFVDNICKINEILEVLLFNSRNFYLLQKVTNKKKDLKEVDIWL